MRKISIFIFSLVFLSNLYCQKRYTTNEYVSRFKEVAINEMKRSGIPASITLAQGILESDNGNSKLSREANNHFGIKCHKWEGKTIYMDDDQPNECFRKYESAWQSYRDHTNFLMTGKRYAPLFEKKCNDYEAWAKGLKKAGYATNPSYPKLLIRTIEDNHLQQYDCGNTDEIKKETVKTDKDEFTIELKHRKIYVRNRIKYIIVEPGDDIKKITEEMDLMRWELRWYNDLTDSSVLKSGQILYIQPKRRKAEEGKEFHCVDSGQTMYEISQLYGVKLRKLYRKNRMQKGTQPIAGQKLWLRSKMPKKAENKCK